MINVEYSEALSEIDDILNHLDVDVLNRIPEKFKTFVKDNKSKKYNPSFDHSKKLNELPMRDKTRAILSVIYMNFLCNEEEKVEYAKKLKDNSLKKEKELRENYNTDNLFKRKTQKIDAKPQSTENTVKIKKCKDNILQKFINIIIQP